MPVGGPLPLQHHPGLHAEPSAANSGVGWSRFKSQLHHMSCVTSPHELWGSVYLLISFLIWKMGRAEVPRKAAVRKWSTGLGPQSSCETGWASPSWEARRVPGTVPGTVPEMTGVKGSEKWVVDFCLVGWLEKHAPKQPDDSVSLLCNLQHLQLLRQAVWKGKAHLLRRGDCLARMG